MRNTTFLETAEPQTSEREAISYIDTVLQPEDIALLESVQRGMHSPEFTLGRYGGPGRFGHE